jgi:hypothetical protein
MRTCEADATLGQPDVVIAFTIVLAAAMALIAFELGLRWADGVPLLWLPQLGRERAHHPFFQHHHGATYHRTLGWTNSPNQLHGFSTDEYGNRLPSARPRPLPIGGILACGDSFTAGSEVIDEHSWPALIETQLGIPVINAAAGGWGTDQIMLRAEEMIELAHPTTLIVSFFWDDIHRSEYRTYGRAHKPYYVIKNDALELRNVPVPLFSGHSGPIKWLRPLLDHCYMAFCLAQYLGLMRWSDPTEDEYVRSAPDGSGADITCLLLRRLKTKVEERGIRFVLLLQYGWEDIHLNRTLSGPRLVAESARALGIEVLDLWPILMQDFKRDAQAFLRLWVIEVDGKPGHMSETGNRFVAEKLVALLGCSPAT